MRGSMNIKFTNELLVQGKFVHADLIIFCETFAFTRFYSLKNLIIWQIIFYKCF